MIYQAYYSCRACPGVYLFEHEKGNINAPKQSNIACAKDTPPCMIWISPPTPVPNRVELRGYFHCSVCSENVVMPMHQGRYPTEKLSHNCLKCLNSGLGEITLNYVSSGPEESFTAYESNEGWDLITQHIKLTAPPREEADSQRNVRAYLIKEGFGFLAGDGGTTARNDQLEFTSYHPTFTIDEPGFTKKGLLGLDRSKSNVILTPRISCGVLGKDTSRTAWPDFVVSDGIEKIAYELKTPKTYGIGYGSNTGGFQGKEIDLGFKRVKVGRDIGFTAAWLFTYAIDIHKEAYSRNLNMPDDYRNIFLIDLTVVGQSVEEVIQDLKILLKQTAKHEEYGERLYIFSASWWKKYWYSVHFFFQNKIEKGNFYNKIQFTLTTYDEKKKEWNNQLRPGIWDNVNEVIDSIKGANPPQNGHTYSQQETQVLERMEDEIRRTFFCTDHWDQLKEDIIGIALYSTRPEGLWEYLEEIQSSTTKYRR